MKTIPILVLFCLVISVVGCAFSVAQTSTIPALTKTSFPTLESKVTATFHSLHTATVPLRKLEISTLPSDPTISPTPPKSTTVPAPLSETGPWLLLSKDTNYDGPTAIIDPILTNKDGSAWEPLNVPHPLDAKPDEYSWWYGEPAPNKPIIAIQSYLSEYFPTCIENAPPVTTLPPFEDILHIIKLPENKVVHEIRLLGLKANAQIQKDDCSLKEGEGIPAVLGVTRLPGSLSWSPDGRYLVFPAAPDNAAADLYRYDTESNTFRRLTTRQNNPNIIGWSPDGQTVIYEGVTKMDWYHNRIIESSGVYAVSVSGTDRLLFKTDVGSSHPDWLSQSQFLISSGSCDFLGSGLCNSHLRLLDLSTAENEVIYNSKSVFAQYVTDPIHHLLLFVDPPADMAGIMGGEAFNQDGRGTGEVKGIYQYNFQTRSLQPIHLDPLPENVSWSQGYQSFLLSYSEQDQIANIVPRSALMRYQPKQGFQLEKLESSSRSHPSPDGQWSIGQVGDDSYILDRQGQPIQKVITEWGYWSPDSSSFIQLQEDMKIKGTILSVYSRDNNWQNTLTRYLTTGYLWWGMWIMK